MGCSYFSIGFSLLSSTKFLPVYKGMYWYFHIALIGSLLVFIALTPKRAKTDKGKTE